MASQHSVKALLITNPQSRHGTVDQLQEGLERLHDAGFDVESVQSSSPSESREIVESRHQYIDLVILAGGDGTISSMAETLLDCKLTLAVLPLGTANDLARSLGVADSLEAAFNAIIANRRQRIDLGRLNGHYFFNAAHIGLGVKVTEELTDKNKKRWGVFSYLKALFAALARTDQFAVKITVDGRSHRMRSIHLAVGNGRFYGGGNVIHKNARIDDRQLSVYSLKPQKLWRLLLLAPLLRSGSHQRHRRIFTARGLEIEVQTKRPMAIHADGEPVCYTPARFEVYPEALEAIVAVPKD
ncbi:lipid kinase [Marinobacter halotolerans]|uniref:lipid kinase n=1 Tax=Marinobacter halotolerans TaxID=1569211 RepID=UPI001248C434|nr:lipid kinase [Marinobacter halotolerans]